MLCTWTEGPAEVAVLPVVRHLDNRVEGLGDMTAAGSAPPVRSGLVVRLSLTLLFRSFTKIIGGGSRAWFTGSSDYVAGPGCLIDLLRLCGPLSQNRCGIPRVEAS